MEATKEGCRGEDVYSPADAGGTENAGGCRQEVEGFIAIGMSGTDFVEGRCGWSGLDGSANRRCIWLPAPNGREHTRAVGEGGF